MVPLSGTLMLNGIDANVQTFPALSVATTYRAYPVPLGKVNVEEVNRVDQEV
jgi:hypothetical protein